MLKLHQVLKSSRAAIDLASIMVGIIVIGLIGGVIAATVFAVIPWAQDNAAKQQLDPIASAESAYRGLSTSKDANLQDAASSPTSATDPNQVVLNSAFTGSLGLAKNNLLNLSETGAYCVVATADGKDYHGYSKSGSGKWFYITSGKTQATTYTGSNVPCVTSGATAGTVDPTTDNGTTVVGTPPGATTPGGGTTPPPSSDYGVPVGTTVYSQDFNSETLNTLPSGWNAYNQNNIAISTNLRTKTVNANSNSASKTAYYSLYASYTGGNTTTLLEFNNAYDTYSINSASVTLKPGTYSASALTAKGTNTSWLNWTMNVKDSSNAVIGSTSWKADALNGSSGTTTAYVWRTDGTTFTVTKDTTVYLSWTGTGGATNGSPQMVDDVKIVKTANAG
jgi:hypothetical protein